MASVSDLTMQMHLTAKAKGFWDDGLPKRLNGKDTDRQTIFLLMEKLALIGTEVAEAIEAVRVGDRNNFAEELADIVIRVGDLAEASGVYLEQAILTKMGMNITRPTRHGKLA